MDINNIILWIISFGVVLGGLDYILKNKFKIGKEFEEGFMALGPLALVVVGIVSLAPVIARVLGPVIAPILRLIGADPSVLASILALDMGGYPLAMELAKTETSGLFSGLIVASMLGATLVFSIPVALKIIKEKDKIFFIKGLLAGLITIPIGAFIGGIIAGFPFQEVLLNTIPVLIISIILVLFLKFLPNKILRFAAIFGRFMIIIITIGLVAAVFEALTGIVVIPGMAPVSDGLKIVGLIGIVLLGAFPIVRLITRFLRKPLEKFGNLLSIGANDVAGLLASLANNIPMFHLMKKMSDRGKIINCAFMVSGAFILGDHLGFIAGVNRNMIFAVIVAKLIAAALAIPVAMIIAKKTERITKLEKVSKQS